MDTMTRHQVQDELQRIADEHGGRLTADLVLAHAQDSSNPLHAAFEWDDAKAAHRHRQQRARELIRSVRVSIRTERHIISCVGYVRDPMSDNGVQGYIAVPTLLSDAELSRVAVLEEFQRAAAHLRRARNLAAALEVSEDIATALHVVDDLQTRFRGEQPRH